MPALGVCSAASCGTLAPSRVAPPSPAPSVATLASAARELSACTDNDASPLMLKIMLAVERRETDQADDLLLARLADHPSDLGADTALEALRAFVEELRTETLRTIESTAPTNLDLQLRASGRQSAAAATDVVVESDLGRGGFYAVKRPEHIDPGEMRRFRPLPAHLPAAPPRAAFQHIHFPDQDIVLHEQPDRTRILVAAADRRPRLFSFPGRATMARLVGDVLVASTGIIDSGPRSKGDRLAPDLFAFDASSGGVLWSASDTGASAVLGDYVLSKSDQGIVVRNVESGTTVKTVPTQERARGVVTQGQRAYVLGIARSDLVLRVVPEVPGRAPNLPPLANDTVFLSKEGACRYARAFDAIGARDRSKLNAALADLRSAERPSALLDLVRKASERLGAWRSSVAADSLRVADMVDLFAAPPKVLPAPPWQRSPPAPPVSAKAGRVVLTQRSVEAFRHWDHAEMHPATRGALMGLSPAQQSQLRTGGRTDIPAFFGVSGITFFGTAGDDALVLYGERWLAVLRKQGIPAVFDLDAYRHPPITKPKDAFPGSPTYVNSAAMRGSVLYLCNGGGSYASMARGKTGYVTAIDTSTGAVVWQSEPLVCNTETTFFRDYLITGYGFTDEPDFVRVLRLSDGSVVGKASVDTAPAEFLLAGDRLTVHTYEKRFVFDLAER
jgi:hypothetical protein